jgi:thiamine biosynthesis lipoprotein
MFKPLLVLLAFFLSACQQQEIEDKLIQKQYFIFGTIIEVLVWHHDVTLVNQAFSEVEKALNGMHSQWHAWKTGRLHEMNKAMRAGKAFSITDEETEFIQATKILSQQSQGNFNPAIGELIHLWGFHTDNYPITTPPPGDAEINDFLAHLPTMQDISISNNQISTSNRRIWLDYGGVAKGYAIDKAINILKKHGIKNAIVNAGGDLRSIGSKGDKNWRVAIRKPNSEDILAVITVQGDESVFTSGNYERYKEFNGQRYAHIIDPKTGKGVDQIVSATIIAENGTKADAAATAMIVAGNSNWHKIAQTMQLDQVLLVDAEGNCFASEKIMPRLEKIEVVCEILE